MQTAHHPSSLAAQGYRFYVNGNDATWRHPTAMRPGDIDATDMSDVDFTALIARENARDAADNGLVAYAFSFREAGNPKRFRWVRYGKSMEAALDIARAAAKRDYPTACSFLITRVDP